MTPELAYFLKINVAIALFYAFYRLFFHKDTFFHWRRTALLCFFGISLLYPLLNIQEWIKEQEPMVAMADLYATIILPEQIIEAPQETTANWQELIPQILGFIYWTGVLLLALRFLIQLGSIIRLHFLCPKSTIQGSRVHILKKGTGPFSFFHWIFIHPESHTESEISEIITHEETHARQYHSADVLVSEIMCTFCWFNPFVWLMKREVRGNLEYMADNRVLEAGHDSKSYQYHLLGLAHQKSAITLSNSFNVLPLKNRITMMNKKRTKEIGRTKYLLFIPLALALMIVSNIEAVARTTKSIAQEVMQTVEEQMEPENAVAVKESTSSPQTANHISQPQESGIAEQPAQEESRVQIVFEVVEKMPEFPDGVRNMNHFINSHLRYPVIAQENGTQGQVIAQFVIQADGTLSDLKIVKSVDPLLDAEAMRVIKEMPKWQPGKQRGIAVATRVTVPIRFRLMDSDSAPSTDSNKNQENTIFDVVERAPEFPGGMEACLKYMYKNIKYPAVAMEAGIQGQVVIQIVIDKDGKIHDPKIVRGVSPELNAEAIRVISNMPQWIPGKQKGKNVATRFTLPVRFRLA